MARREQNFPDNPQQSSRGKVRSWLLSGWMSKNGEDESYNKNNSSSHSHTDNTSSLGGGGGHSSSFANEDSKSNHAPVLPEQPKKKKITFAEVEDEKITFSKVEDEKKDGDHEEAPKVDKSADDFIAKQKSKLEMERLISMKRYESMLNRGI